MFSVVAGDNHGRLTVITLDAVNKPLTLVLEILYSDDDVSGPCVPNPDIGKM